MANDSKILKEAMVFLSQARASVHEERIPADSRVQACKPSDRVLAELRGKVAQSAALLCQLRVLVRERRIFEDELRTWARRSTSSAKEFRAWPDEYN